MKLKICLRVYSLLIISLFGCESGVQKNNIYGDNGEVTIFKKSYPSGNIMIQEQFVNDKRYGEAFYYYDELDTFLVKKDQEYHVMTEPLLEKYRFFNSRGNVAFEWTYSKNGNIQSKFGSTIVEYYFPDTIRANEEVKYHIIIPRPKNSINELYMGELVDSKIDYLEPLEIRKNSVTIENRLSFDSSGYRKMIIISNLLNNENDVIMSDTIEFNVLVR